MKKAILLLVLPAFLAGCVSNMTKQESGTMMGAMVGAAAGGAAKGRKGAVIGAIFGGIAGNLIGQYMDKQEAMFRSSLNHEINNGRVSLERSDDGSGMVLSLDGQIMFESGSDRIRPAAYDELNRIIRAWNDNPDVNVIITGHTDNVGSLKHNRDLSARRAEAVVLYMLKRGVPFQRIYTRGAGELAPVADNNTAQGRQQNRRVDMVFYPARQEIPDVVLSLSEDTEPAGYRTTQKPASPPMMKQKVADTYAFTPEQQKKASSSQEKIQQKVSEEPISPIRSASELLKHV